jgi:hypothetical protein
MESFHDSEIMPCDHEPCDWTAGLRPGARRVEDEDEDEDEDEKETVHGEPPFACAHALGF